MANDTRITPDDRCIAVNQWRPHSWGRWDEQLTIEERPDGSYEIGIDSGIDGDHEDREEAYITIDREAFQAIVEWGAAR